MTIIAIRVGTLLLLPVALLSISGHDRQAAAVPGQPAQAEVQPPAQPSEQRPVDVELDRRRQQIAQARSRCSLYLLLSRLLAEQPLDVKK
jgi:hypothetical protein